MVHSVLLLVFVFLLGFLERRLGVCSFYLYFKWSQQFSLDQFISEVLRLCLCGHILRHVLKADREHLLTGVGLLLEDELGDLCEGLIVHAFVLESCTANFLDFGELLFLGCLHQQCWFLGVLVS